MNAKDQPQGIIQEVIEFCNLSLGLQYQVI